MKSTPQAQPLPGMAVTIEMVAMAHRSERYQHLTCPKCGAPESNPVDNGATILIRGYKVDDWSQCLVCAGYYNPADLSDYDDTRGDGKKGWFR
jgi:hypothetical protein